MAKTSFKLEKPLRQRIRNKERIKYRQRSLFRVQRKKIEYNKRKFDYLLEMFRKLFDFSKYYYCISCLSAKIVFKIQKF